MTTLPELTLPIPPDFDLTLLNHAHTPEFLALIDRSRPYLREWLAWLDRTRTVAELSGFIDSTIQEYTNKKAIALWIRHQQKIVGIIHLREIDPGNRKAMIGYWVGQEYRGQGFAKRACQAVVTHAFQELKLNRVEIRCATGNTASRRVPLSLGFQEEGVLRDNEWLYDHFVDHVVYGMLARNWQP